MIIHILYSVAFLAICIHSAWEDVKWADYPYMAVLKSVHGICGGAILTLNGAGGNGAIITAAHCTHGPTHAPWIVIGCDNINPVSYSCDSAKTYFQDPSRPPIVYSQDIGVIFLSEPIAYAGATSIQPWHYPINNGDNLIVTGYGGISKNSLEKQTFEVTGCDPKYHNHMQMHDEEWMCVIDPARENSLCGGDSGSPILANGKLVGIVSVVYDGDYCDPNHVQAGVRVSHFYNWILSQACIYAPLYRLWSGRIADHLYDTVSFQNVYDWNFEGITAHIGLNEMCSDMVPLYRYWCASCGDHYYNTDSSVIGTLTIGQIGNYGYKYEGVAGYCYPTQRPGTIPLYLYFNPSHHDNLLNTDANEIGTTTIGQIGNHGYRYDGILCYVFGPSGVGSVKTSHELQIDYKYNEKTVYFNVSKSVLIVIGGLLLLLITINISMCCMKSSKNYEYSKVNYVDSDTDVV
eukprot:359582_1